MLGAATPRSVQGATPPPASALQLYVSFFASAGVHKRGGPVGYHKVYKPRSANPGIKAVLPTYTMLMLLGAARARSLAARFAAFFP